MAEPLILAYGRGELPEFPAAGDTIVDIVPVDHVVSRDRGRAGPPAGARRAGVLPRLLGRPEPAHLPGPLRQRPRVLRRAPVRPPATAARPGCRTGGSPARSRSSGCCRPARGPARSPTTRIGHAPRSDRTRDLARKLRPAGPTAGVPAPLPRPLQGVRPGRAALLRRAARWRSSSRCTPEDRETFAFDTAVVDWRHYLERRALPGRHRADPRASTSCRRAAAQASPPRDALTRRRVGRRRRRGVLRHGRHPAVLQRDRDLPVAAAAASSTAPSGSPSSAGSPPGCRAWSGPSGGRRSAFLRAIYREYAGARLADLDAIVDEELTSHVLARLSPAAVRRIREHRAAGPPHGADHRRDPAADPAAGAAVRPHRGRRAGGGRPRRLHRLPGLVAAGRGVAGGLDAVRTPPRTAST